MGQSAPVFNGTHGLRAKTRFKMICDYEYNVRWAMMIVTGRDKRTRSPKRVSHKPGQRPF
jgi:hypothetical protein